MFHSILHKTLQDSRRSSLDSFGHHNVFHCPYSSRYSNRLFVLFLPIVLWYLYIHHMSFSKFQAHLWKINNVEYFVCVCYLLLTARCIIKVVQISIIFCKLQSSSCLTKMEHLLAKFESVNTNWKFLFYQICTWIWKSWCCSWHKLQRHPQKWCQFSFQKNWNSTLYLLKGFFFCFCFLSEYLLAYQGI